MSPENWEALEAIAAERGVKKGKVVEEMIKTYSNQRTVARVGLDKGAPVYCLDCAGRVDGSIAMQHISAERLADEYSRTAGRCEICGEALDA